MKACMLRISGDALRVKLNLPEGVRVTTVLHSLQRHDTYLVHLEGIGPKLVPGGVLQQVEGKVNLDVENGLSWEIS